MGRGYILNNAETPLPEICFYVHCGVEGFSYMSLIILTLFIESFLFQINQSMGIDVKFSFIYRYISGL